MGTQIHLEALVQVRAPRVFHDLFHDVQLLEAYELLKQSMEENYNGEYTFLFVRHASRQQAYYLLDLQEYRY